jgi:hypothetical protein
MEISGNSPLVTVCDKCLHYNQGCSRGSILTMVDEVVQKLDEILTYLQYFTNTTIISNF